MAWSQTWTCLFYRFLVSWFKMYEPAWSGWFCVPKKGDSSFKRRKRHFPSKLKISPIAPRSQNYPLKSKLVSHIKIKTHLSLIKIMRRLLISKLDLNLWRHNTIILSEIFNPTRLIPSIFPCFFLSLRLSLLDFLPNEHQEV